MLICILHFLSMKKAGGSAKRSEFTMAAASSSVPLCSYFLTLNCSLQTKHFSARLSLIDTCMFYDFTVSNQITHNSRISLQIHESKSKRTWL